MYAIIRAGGHQEKVSAGDTITVDRLKTEVGGEVKFVPLMVSKDDGTVVSERSALAEAAVVGKVLEHTKGDKVDVFQYRNKTGYRRHVGHRQPLTLVEIAEIRLGSLVARAEEAKAAAAEQAEAAATAKAEAATAKAERKAGKKAAAGKAEPAAKKPAAEPAAKKATAKKATAKKTTAKKTTAKKTAAKKPAEKPPAAEED